MLSRHSKLSKKCFSIVKEGRHAVIVSAVRTPIGSFNGVLKDFSAPKLGGISIAAAIKNSGLTANDVQEVYMGNVVSAGLGQAPARQASVHAGLPHSAVCTTLNKMCASGMKSVMLASQNIMLGFQDCLVAGGFESMTNAPYYVPKARFGYKFGNAVLEDGLAKDGLTDAYNDQPMGFCTEETAKKYNITREEQDRYAIESYRRAAEATKNGYFRELVPLSIPQKKGDPIFITEDEEYKNVKIDKIPTLNPAFKKDGTITAANSSKLSDGAAALVIVSEEKARRAGLKPLARIIGFGDAEQLPNDFPTSPAFAIPRALKHAGLDIKDIEYFEINEAFATVPLANARILDLDLARLNIYGGAVALGHPIGSSGARIISTLISVLRNNNATYGVASICNGGGGASAVVIERLN